MNTAACGKKLAPATQIRNAIVDHLRAEAQSFSLPALPEQIRGKLDVSGAPKGAWGIVVSAADLGDHGGNTGRVLVDIQPKITVFSHLEEDVDGSICDAISADVLELIQGIQYSLEGWYVAWNGNWTITEVTMTDSFRQVTLISTIPIVKQ